MLKFIIGLKEILWDNPFRDWFLGVIFIVNIAGAIYGFFWYQHQLAHTDFYWLPFVPDSPLSCLFLALALLLALLGRKSGMLFLLGSIMTMKYGLWAVAVISDFWLRGGTPGSMQIMLWLSHWGMALEGFIFLRQVRISWIDMLVIFLWLFLNDFTDYYFGQHPYLYTPDQFLVAMWSALLLTGCLGVVTYLKVLRSGPARSWRRF